MGGAVYLDNIQGARITDNTIFYNNKAYIPSEDDQTAYNYGHGGAIYFYCDTNGKNKLV